MACENHFHNIKAMLDLMRGWVRVFSVPSKARKNLHPATPTSICRYNLLRGQQRPALGLAVFSGEGLLLGAPIAQGKDLQIHLRKAGPDHSELPGCAVGEVDNAPLFN